MCFTGGFELRNPWTDSMYNEATYRKHTAVRPQYGTIFLWLTLAAILAIREFLYWSSNAALDRPFRLESLPTNFSQLPRTLLRLCKHEIFQALNKCG